MIVTFRNFQRIHLVGIGGIGMSGIAEVLLSTRLFRFRLGFEDFPGHRAPAESGRGDLRGAQSRAGSRRARRGGFFGGARDNRKSPRRTG